MKIAKTIPYDITVEFTLNDPSIYNPNDPNVAFATLGADFGVQGVGVIYTNGLGKTTIPKGQDYVDVIIKAKNDNMYDDNERVYLNIVDAYALKGHSFQFTTYTANNVQTNGSVTVYPGDYVLIKEVGWAVKSVVWVQHPNGNGLQSYRTSVNQDDYWIVFMVGAFHEDNNEKSFFV